jgi:hypothetical protein
MGTIDSIFQNSILERAIYPYVKGEPIIHPDSHYLDAELE